MVCADSAHLPRNPSLQGTKVRRYNEYEWNLSPRRMLTTPVNTQDRPFPLRNNCFNPTPISYCPLICYLHSTLFSQLILHVDVVLCNCSNSRICLFIYIRLTLTFFSVLSPSHFILALWQSCVLSTVVLINEYE